LSVRLGDERVPAFFAEDTQMAFAPAAFAAPPVLRCVNEP